MARLKLIIVILGNLVDAPVKGVADDVARSQSGNMRLARTPQNGEIDRETDSR